MKPYRDALLEFAKQFNTNADSLWSISREGGSSYPNPSDTSWNGTVNWTLKLEIGRGYFTGVIVWYIGKWNTPHPNPNGGEDTYIYAQFFINKTLEEAVDLFLKDELPAECSQP